MPEANVPTWVRVPADTIAAIMAMQYTDISPLTASDIRRKTARDAVKSQASLPSMRGGFQPCHVIVENCWYWPLHHSSGQYVQHQWQAAEQFR